MLIATFAVQAAAPPSISSVSPNPVASDTPQPFTINGNNFVIGANVTLRDWADGYVYPNLGASWLSSTQIVINWTFPTPSYVLGGSWSVEVINPDRQSSGQFWFEVVAPPVITQQPLDQLVTAGQTAVFEAGATCSPACGSVVSVQWQQSTDGGTTFNDISGANSRLLSFTAALSDNGNQYHAVFTSFVAVTTQNATLTVTKATTTTALSASPNPSTFGQAVTFTGTVTSSGGTPTGMVTFKDGATTLGSGTLSAGTATFNTTALSGGTHSVTAVYGGDPNFGTSTSSAVTQTVNYTITLTASPLAGGTVSGGGAYPAGGSRTVTATAASGYTFTNWTESSSVVSTSASYIFTLTANRTPSCQLRRHAAAGLASKSGEQPFSLRSAGWAVLVFSTFVSAQCHER